MSGSTLNPELLWIGRDYCYRLNPLAASCEADGHAATAGNQLKPVGQLEEEAECEVDGEGAGAAATGCCYNDEVEDQLAGCQIESCGGGGGGGGFRMRLPLPAAFHRFLIGRHGDTKRRLEAETGAELRIPRMGDSESPVLVLARTRAQLASVKTRLDLLLGNARERLPITHFLSVRVASEEVTARYREFREAALRWCGGERGVTEAAFQQPERLHVTCAPLLLLTSQEVERARRLLDEFAREELPRLINLQSSGPLRVSLRGLEIMNDDPSDTRVLYARLSDPSGRLQSLADALAARFAPLVRAQPGREGVKLHVTLMNAKFSADAPAPDGGVGEDRQAAPSPPSFDAGHLLSKFADFDFGSASLESLQLSKLGGGAARDAYYACEHSVAMV